MTKSSALITFVVACFVIISSFILVSNFSSSLGSEDISMLVNQKLISLPKLNNSMSDLFHILHALESNIPFGYAHFNDGEMTALNCAEGEKTVFSWSQRCTPRLNHAMQNAFQNTASNFYIGIPCNCEFRGVAYLIALQYLNITHDLPYQLSAEYSSNWPEPAFPASDDEACPATPATLTIPNAHLRDRITVATLFINGNFIKAKKELIRIMNKAVTIQKRGIHVVVAHDRKVERLPFPLKSVQYVARENAFETNYEDFRTPQFLNAAQYEPNDIVLIMAGPVGRILASEWGLLRSDVTFLEMGSFWDAELWNRPKHHLGVVRSCMGKSDRVGLRCENRWIHFLPQIIPEGYFPLRYFC